MSNCYVCGKPTKREVSEFSVNKRIKPVYAHEECQPKVPKANTYEDCPYCKKQLNSTKTCKYCKEKLK